VRRWRPAGLATAGCLVPTGPATPELAADLQFLREEEKLARDVYLTLYDAWQLAPHQNIAESEQTHTDRVLDLLVALDLPDPVVDDTVGVFVNPQLAGLYVELVATGRRTEVASLEVGATIEDLDLRDLNLMAARTTDAGVLATYEALACGSRNHLRSFSSQLGSRGVTYAPHYLSQTDYDAIVSSDRESCGR
jgi:hypothetical protein